MSYDPRSCHRNSDGARGLAAPPVQAAGRLCRLRRRRHFQGGPGGRAGGGGARLDHPHGGHRLAHRLRRRAALVELRHLSRSPTRSRGLASPTTWRGGGQYFAIFADGHHRQLPRLTGGPFRYKSFASDSLKLSIKSATKPMKQAVIAPSMLALLYPLDEEIEGYSREAFEADLDRRVREGRARSLRCRCRQGFHRLHRGPAFLPQRFAQSLDRPPDASPLHRADQRACSTASRRRSG